MKILKVAFLMVILGAMAYPQTKDLGLGAFSNEAGPIIVAVDAAVAIDEIKNPYLLFLVWMAPKDSNKSQNIVVARDGVTMIYKGQEYKLPTVAELRKNYRGEIRDIDFYRHLTKAGIISSWIRFYKFTARTDFFPPLTQRAPLPAEEGSMTDSLGFMTKCYFKNPGFEKGDKLTIKVVDKNNPQITGECEVTLK